MNCLLEKSMIPERKISRVAILLYLSMITLLHFLAVGVWAESREYQLQAPTFGQITLEFGRTDIIGNSEEGPGGIFSYVLDLKTDSRENIFLLDFKQKGVLRFDRRGKFVKTYGQEGVGPGDYLRAWKLFINGKNHIFVSDRGSLRITEIDPSGKTLDIIRLKHGITSDFFVDPRGNIYGFILIQKGMVPMRTLVRMDRKDEKFEAIAEYPDRTIQVKGRGSSGVRGWVIHRHGPGVFLSAIDEKSFCFGFNLENKVHIYNVDRMASKVIYLNGKTELFSADEKEYFRKNVDNQVPLPPHKPFFYGLLVDEKARIYVFRVNSVYAPKEPLTMDVFDTKGNYLYRVLSPVTPLYIRSGNVYAAAEDDDDEFIIKRFAIKNYNTLKCTDDLKSIGHGR